MSDMYTRLFDAAIGDVIQYVVPASGNTVLVQPGVTLLFLNPAGLLSTLTVSLPDNPVDGQRLVIAASAVITLLTVNNGTVKGLITSLALNGFARYAYSAQAASWFRTG